MLLVADARSYSVCRLSGTQPAWAAAGSAGPAFVAVTPDEVSLVCPTDNKPPDCLSAEDGWSLLRVDGQLDFGLVGIIADISGTLARAGIPVFVVSTYLTDYVLVKTAQLPDARTALRNAGHAIESGSPAR